jgi:hypothetical protein
MRPPIAKVSAGHRFAETPTQGPPSSQGNVVIPDTCMHDLSWKTRKMLDLDREALQPYYLVRQGVHGSASSAT